MRGRMSAIGRCRVVRDGRLIRVAGVETGAVLRVLAAMIRPLMMLWRMWRPIADKASVAALADELAVVIRREEERLRDKLRAGPGSFMHVGFTAAAGVHPGDGIESAEVSDIAAYFELLPPSRRLVVLGEPGSGKTVAAAHLVLGLLAERRDLADARRAEEPVPVRVNAAGWDGSEDFSGWLATRLEHDHRLRPPLARALVRDRLILPVIDGLDEMDTADSKETRARELLNRLNESPWGNRSVVVVCRSSEFEELASLGEDNGLHGSTTITLRPFTPDQISGYLATYKQRIGATKPLWAEVITHITHEPDGPLASALSTPWMLGLAATALHHDPRTAEQLTGCVATDTVRDLLFAAQIPAAVAGTDRTGPYRDYTPDNVCTWMQSLARCLEHRREAGHDGTTIQLDEIWEIMGTTRCRLLHALGAGLLVAMTCGLLLGPRWGLSYGLVSGLVFGIGCGLTVGLNKYPSANRMAWRVPTRSRWPLGLTFGLLFGLGFGLVGGLVLGAGHGPEISLRAGVVGGLVGGLTYGLMVGLRTNARDRLGLAVDERQLIHDDLRAAAFIGGMFGLTLGSTLGLTEGLVVGVEAGLLWGLTVGLTFGPVSGRYFVAALVFRLTKIFPSKPMVFLDWARRSGLLRVTGIAYQFRHETY